MATNVLHQVSWFVPCTHAMNSSRSNQLASSKFALSFGYKAQLLKSYSLSGYGFRKTLYPHVARRNLVAFAESVDAAPAEDSAESTPVEEESTEDTQSSLVVQDVAEQPQVALARTRRPKLNQLMGYLNKQAVDAVEEKRPIPDIRVGDVVQLRVTVPRTRRRFALYKGVVISRQNAGIQTTIRVRRIIAGVGVEIVFPIYSPLITEVTILEHKKVRRARLYYLRDKLPKFSTVK